MKTLLALFAAAALLSAASPEDAVKQAEQSFAKAIVAKDLATLEKLLGDDLSYNHSDGRHDTKATYIDNLKTGKQKYEKAEPADLSVKIYGNTAVLTGVLKVVTDRPISLSILHVYVKRGSQWQLVAHQSARLP